MRGTSLRVHHDIIFIIPLAWPSTWVRLESYEDSHHRLQSGLATNVISSLLIPPVCVSYSRRSWTLIWFNIWRHDYIPPEMKDILKSNERAKFPSLPPTAVKSQSRKGGMCLASRWEILCVYIQDVLNFISMKNGNRNNIERRKIWNYEFQLSSQAFFRSFHRSVCSYF